MKSSISKHSVKIDGRLTSISLEDEFWRSIQNIAASHSSSVSDLVSKIASERQGRNLSSALRLFVLRQYQQGYRDTERGSAEPSLMRSK